MAGATESRVTIAVDAFDGPNRAQRARQRAAALTRSTGMDDFFVESVGQRAYVYFGRYDLAEQEEARAALARLRQLRQAGRLEAELLTIVPLPGAAPPAVRDMDLRNATPGAIYTLQVGVFDPGHEGDYRRAAEQRAAELREAGHDAYFYHGPNRSMVTLGAFARGAIRQPDQPGKQMQYHPYVRKLREEFPHNLRNGQRFSEGGESTYQESFLVRIPGR